MSSRIIGPYPKKKLAPSENVTPGEEIEKRPKILDDIGEPVFTIRSNNLNNFQGNSTRSTGWLYLYRAAYYQ